jgi:hypothetical protein
VSALGIVSIVVGVIMLCSRGALLVAPRATLRWFGWMIETNGRTRALGAVVLALGAVMAWAGAGADGGLATLLYVVGWVVAVFGTFGLLVFPSVYRSIGEALLPSDGEDLTGWRGIGLVGVVIGAALIYYGALAL